MFEAPSAFICNECVMGFVQEVAERTSPFRPAADPREAMAGR